MSDNKQAMMSGEGAITELANFIDSVWAQIGVGWPRSQARSLLELAIKDSIAAAINSRFPPSPEHPVAQRTITTIPDATLAEIRAKYDWMHLDRNDGPEYILVSDLIDEIIRLRAKLVGPDDGPAGFVQLDRSPDFPGERRREPKGD